MKLEAIDPLNLGNICVATICKVSLGLALQPLKVAFWEVARWRRALHSPSILPSPLWLLRECHTSVSRGVNLLLAQNLLSCQA